MSRLWWDGFEYGKNEVFSFLYPDSTFTFASSGPQTGIGLPYTGTYGLRISSTDSGNILCLTLVSAKTELYAKFHFRPQAFPVTRPVMGFYNGTTCLAWLREVDRNLELYSGTGTGTQLGSTAVNVLSANAIDWNLIEVRLLLDDSTGYAQVRVNEALVIDFGPGDTKPGAEADIDRVNLGKVGGATLSGGCYFDDFIVDDAEWVGNKRVFKVQPTGVGTNAEWDPSTGANWDTVDEIPYSDTDFVSTNVTNEIDTYGCSDLPGTATSAKGLMVIIRAAEEGTATPQNVQIALLTDGEYHYSGSYAPPSGSPGFYKYLWATNPKTTVDWTVALVNAVEIGVKAVA